MRAAQRVQALDAELPVTQLACRAKRGFELVAQACMTMVARRGEQFRHRLQPASRNPKLMQPVAIPRARTGATHGLAPTAPRGADRSVDS